jgi:hypothetical protein
LLWPQKFPNRRRDPARTPPYLPCRARGPSPPGRDYEAYAARADTDRTASYAISYS